MGEPAIRVRGLSKRYEVFDTQRARLAHALWPAYRDGMQEIRALRDVEFEVAHGESIAVIGRNGSGKSTLLQILTGVLTPTAGEVEVNGRVSALLELGSGFNPEYSGRDNVMLNGLLLGLGRSEILARFDEIAAFAEIGDAIDRPVKTYSSGMLVRLAFAVQALTDPEILVIDEALGVGDFFFQQKCFAHIRGLIQKGVTLVLVSHDLRTVRDLCTRAVYLRRGAAEFVGDSQVAIQRYLAETTAKGERAAVAAARDPVAAAAQALWLRTEPAAGAALLAVELAGADGAPVSSVRMGEKVVLRVRFRAAPEEAGHISLVVKNRYDQVVSVLSTFGAGMAPVTSGDEPFATLQLEAAMMLEAGLYSLKVVFGRTTGKNQGTVLDDTGWLGPLRIDWDYERETAPFLGMFGLPMRVELIAGSAGAEVARAAAEGGM